MKNKTAKLTIRARGYGKSITLNDAQTDLVLRAIENDLQNISKILLKQETWGGLSKDSTGPWMDEYKNLELIHKAIKEGPK